MTIVSALIIAASVLVLLGYAGHRAASWAERRGWIYYRNRPPYRGATLGFLEEIYNPAMHHVMEKRDHERGSAEQEESGDGPDPASRDYSELGALVIRFVSASAAVAPS